MIWLVLYIAIAAGIGWFAWTHDFTEAGITSMQTKRAASPEWLEAHPERVPVPEADAGVEGAGVSIDATVDDESGEAGEPDKGEAAGSDEDADGDD